MFTPPDQANCKNVNNFKSSCAMFRMALHRVIFGKNMGLLIEDIYKSSLRLLVPNTPQDLYQAIVTECNKLMDSTWASLYLVKNGTLEKLYSSVPPEKQAIPRKNGFMYQAAVTEKAIIVPREEMVKNHPHVDKKMKTFIAIPLFYGNEPTAVIGIQTKRTIKQLTKSQLHGLRLFGSFASLAIRKTHAQYEAQRISEARDIFISMAAHELRTPMTVIKLYAQMLFKRFDDPEQLEHKWVENLLKETNRTVHIVNELLHTDQVRAGEIKFEHDIHSLRNIINEALSDSRISYPDHNFELVDLMNKQSDLIAGDNNKLIQALINVLNNAAKFSPPNSTIKIELIRSNQGLNIVVEDRGPGIEPDELTHIFDAFYKGRRNQTTEGMGLGLSLVKQVIEKSHGTINIQSSPDQGTKVIIQLPAAG